jgi:hypothetical protein
VIALVYRRRRRLGVAAAGERGLMVGLLGLVVAFLISLPLTAMRMALAVQMQVTRVFWLLDFVMAASVAWWLADHVARTMRARVAAIAILAAMSVGRGAYLLSQDRHFFTVHLPVTPWNEAMTWLKQQPPEPYVLADPGHAWKYGVSVRLAAEKDTLLESGKDTSLAMYDRTIAMAVAERQRAIGDFDRLTAADVRALGARFGVDVVIVTQTHPLDLPVLYRNAEFVIYRLQ